jgi:hypothetical protein
MLKRTQTCRLLLFFALLAPSGCSTWQGVHVDPLNRQRIVSASGYSLDGCQSAMDELAHADVKMLEHTRQLALSIFSFGYEPTYLCTGTAPLAGSSPPAEVPTRQ